MTNVLRLCTSTMNLLDGSTDCGREKVALEHIGNLLEITNGVQVWKQEMRSAPFWSSTGTHLEL